MIVLGHNKGWNVGQENDWLYTNTGWAGMQWHFYRLYKGNVRFDEDEQLFVLDVGMMSSSMKDLELLMDKEGMGVASCRLEKPTEFCT